MFSGKDIIYMFNNDKKIIKCHICEFTIKQTIRVPGDEENGLFFCRTCAPIINKALDTKFITSIEEFKKLKSELENLRGEKSTLEKEIAKLKERLSEVEFIYNERIEKIQEEYFQEEYELISTESLVLA